MFDDKSIKRSLEIGFTEAKPLPEKFLRYRGIAQRSVPMMSILPFEDEQFEVVMLEGSLVSLATIKEIHRVLRMDGRLYFVVPERNSKQSGFTVPDLYAIMREGFNLIQVERPAWWHFGIGSKTITVCAQKKRWKNYKGLDNGHVIDYPFCRTDIR